MRIFTLAFFGKLLATFVIAVCMALGFGPAVWADVVLGIEQPLWVWMLRFALISGAVTIVWLVFISPAIRAGKIILTYHYRPDDTDIVPLRRLIPLPEASRLAYEKLRGRTVNARKLPAKFADMKYGGAAFPISWFGTALLGSGAIPLFGHHSPSTVLEIVPQRLVEASGHLSDDANSIKLYAENRPEYEGLFIKKADFNKRLKEIESWHEGNT